MRRRTALLRRSRPAMLLLALAACALWVVPAGAQSEPPPTGQAKAFVLGLPEGEPLTGETLSVVTEEVSREIRCPVCQGLSIADSPVDTAVAMKAEVREMLAEGYSAEQIYTSFEASYGEFVRLRPKPEGFNLVVWIAPLVGLLLGVVLLAQRLRSARAAAPVDEDPEDEEAIAAAETSEDDPELAAYLEQVRREVGS